MLTNTPTPLKRLLPYVIFVQLFVFLYASYAQAPAVMLDDFESNSVRIINPSETNPVYRYLWNHYPNCANVGTQCLGTVSLTELEHYSGRSSLMDHVTANNAYLEFYPYSDAHSAWGLMHNFLSSGQWRTNTYNRMRLWIKVPLSLPQVTTERYNLEFGTFVRKSSVGDWGGAEDGGGHWYHFFNIPATTEWYQIVVDTHPSHQRGGPGSTEWGDQTHVTGEQNWNYFDALTRFYLDFYNNGLILSGAPADFFVDKVELFQETRPVNIQQVYSLGGVYVRSANKLHVGWQHEKGDETTCHEVRYAFEDVFSIGWNKATPSPNGKVCPKNAVYAGMAYETTAIDVSGHDEIYVAIKPTNSERFNQIVISVPR